MDYSLPGSSVHRILQARILEWVALFRVKALCDFSCTFAGVCVLTGLTHTHTHTHTCRHTYINTHTSMFGEKERRYVSYLESALMFLQRDSFWSDLFGLVHVLIQLTSSILLLDEGWGNDKCQPNI